MKVKLTGWKEGMQKVSLTKLQITYFQMSLKEAKTNVDKLLDGEDICLQVESKEKAQSFLKEVEQIGVIYEIQD
ncbi:hypothetical protein [Spongiimicrobium sp. 2-473A-2-J]|uniref:hypothetical protein n=1 Tax=Eudoraea algarum TaxID=3417568 RepID=UPI003D363B8C